MGFFDWISGIFGSDSREENRSSENNIGKDTSADVEDVQDSSNIKSTSTSEEEIRKPIDQEVTKLDLPQEEEIEIRDKSHSNTEVKDEAI